MKVGDKRTATIEQRTVSIDENGEEDIILEEPLTSRFEVTKINKQYIYLDVLYENVVFRQALKTLEKLDMEGPMGEKLDLKFRIDRNTGESYLVNWEETREFVTSGIDQIVNALDDDSKNFAGLIFQPIKSMFDSEETVQQYFKDNLMLFDDLYGQAYVENDTIHKVDSAANPMMPGQMIVVDYDLIATNLNKVDKTIEIHSFADMDMSFVLDMIKNMARKFSAAAGGDEEKNNEKMKELDDMKMEMTIKEVFLYDYSTGWPLTITKTSSSDMSTPMKSQNSKSIVTITFK
jgi:hypothetical protein